MPKVWRVANGWNINGQLVEIGPGEFDEFSDITAEALAAGIPAPYERRGSYYIFRRRRDWEAAVERLQELGYVE